MIKYKTVNAICIKTPKDYKSWLPCIPLNEKYTGWRSEGVVDFGGRTLRPENTQKFTDFKMNTFKHSNLKIQTNYITDSTRTAQ